MKELKKYIEEVTMKNKGISINNNYEIPKNGYMVAVKNCNSIEGMLKVELKKNEYYGTWLDVEDNNKLYCDISLNIENKEDALKIAKELDELAIFDLSTLESIYL
jgi:hypothetical protein